MGRKTFWALFVLAVVMFTLAYVRRPITYYDGPHKIVRYYDGISCVYKVQDKWLSEPLLCVPTEVLDIEKAKLIPEQNLRVL